MTSFEANSQTFNLARLHIYNYGLSIFNITESSNTWAESHGSDKNTLSLIVFSVRLKKDLEKYKSEWKYFFHRIRAPPNVSALPDSALPVTYPQSSP